MFQKYDTAMADSANLSPTSETSSSMGSIYKSKKALSHFRALKETNTTLSESMSSSMMGRSSAAERGEGAGHSFGSSTSSTGRSYLPVVPSPLHTENTNVTTTSSKPMHIPSTHGAQSRSTGGEREHNASSAVYGTPSSNTSRHQWTPEDDQRYPAFSTYPQDRHHDEMRRLCTVEQHHPHDGNHSKQHCNNHPPPPTPSSPKRPESVTSIATGGHRTSIVDDDDSLVFKMSELSGDGQQQQQQQMQQPRPLLEDETFGPLTEAATRDYARRLGINTDLVGSHPVNSSSTSIPPQSPMATVVEEEEKSTTATSSSSASSSSNIKHHQQQQHHHHHHHHIF